MFAEHQVTFSQFMEHADVTEHSDLVVKYGDRYLTWDNASPLLASLSVYRKSLIDHPEYHKHVSSTEDETSRTTRGWRSWWSSRGSSSLPPDAQSQSSAPTSRTSPPTSPPMSPPDSPRSAPVPEHNDSSPPASPPFPAVEDDENRKHYAKTLRLTSEQLVCRISVLTGEQTLTLAPTLPEIAQTQEGHEYNLVLGSVVLLWVCHVRVSHLLVGIGPCGRNFRH